MCVSQEREPQAEKEKKEREELRAAEQKQAQRATGLMNVQPKRPVSQVSLILPQFSPPRTNRLASHIRADCEGSERERDRERERETSDSPYIKTSTHRQTMFEVLGESSYVFSQPSSLLSTRREREREREREEETSVSPYIKTSTHHTTLYEGLRCWVSHPMFALIPPLFPPLMGTSCDLVFRGLWGMCRYGAVSFLDMLCRDCFVQIDLRLGSTLTYPQHYRFCL